MLLDGSVAVQVTVVEPMAKLPDDDVQDTETEPLLSDAVGAVNVMEAVGRLMPVGVVIFTGQLILGA